MTHGHPTIDRLVDYAHGELPPREDAAIHAHLRECPQCADAYADELSLKEALREHARAQERELPPGLSTAIFANARSSSQVAWHLRMRGWWRPLAALPVAAAIALLIHLELPGSTPHANRVASDANYYLENHAALSATTPLGGNDAIPAILASDDSSR